MKNVLIGCGVVLAVVMVMVAVGGFFAFRAAKKYMEGYAELAEIPQLNQQISNQQAYTPPTDGRMRADQVEEFVAVLGGIHEDLGRRYTELELKYQQLSKDLDERGREANIREILQAWSDIVALVMDAKRAQVVALNGAGLSLSEYHWVREQSLMALGYGAFGFNLETFAQDPASALQDGQPNTMPELETLQHNRALLEPHEEALQEHIALSFFGL